MPIPAILHLHLLGGVRAFVGDTATTLDSARLQALLARLVLHAGVPQPRAHLAFLFWPETTDSQARTNLRQLLYDLRLALPQANRFLLAEGQTLAWKADAPYTLDVDAFRTASAQAQTLEEIDQAVALYQGDLLPGLYDEWLLPERERLRATFTQLLLRGIERAEAEQDHECLRSRNLDPLRR